MGCQTRVMSRAETPAPVVLSDGVVVLRPPTEADIALITQGCQDPEAIRWTTIPDPYGESDAREFVASRRNPADWWAGPVWAITAGDDRWGGTIDLRLDDHRGAEVGYMVAPWLRGQGIATRALRLTCRWGFTALGLEVIRWNAAVGNDASRALAERVGFRVHDQTMRAAIVQRGVRLDAWFGDLTPPDLTETGAPRRPRFTGPELTARERQVLQALATGRTNREIAAHLQISENTVKNHVRAILEKLPAKSRMEAVVTGVHQGLIRLP